MKIRLFMYIYVIRQKTEMEGFEPSRRLPDLPHFECGPFSHLGTSPDGSKNLFRIFRANLYYYIRYQGKGQSFLKLFFPYY